MDSLQMAGCVVLRQSTIPRPFLRLCKKGAVLEWDLMMFAHGVLLLGH